MSQCVICHLCRAALLASNLKTEIFDGKFNIAP